NYTMLYDYGNECIDVTGGWNSDTLTAIKFNGTNMSKSGTAEKLADCLHMTQFNVTGTFKYVSFKTVNQIDLSDFVVSFIKYNTQKVKTGNAQAKLHITNNLNLGDVNKNYSHNWRLEASNLMNPEGANASIISYDDFGTNLKTINGNYYMIASIFFGVSSDGRYETSIYNMTLFKEDAWQTLASIAGISASSIDDILTIASTLLSIEEAVKFMIYNCTGSFMASAIQSSTFLTALNNSSYKTIIQANEHWAKFLALIS
ncbi:MAG: hypothetical protein ACLRFE_03350, partial [Clostridia bacterium]